MGFFETRTEKKVNRQRSGSSRKQAGAKAPEAFPYAYYWDHECDACPLKDADVNSPQMPPSGSHDPLVYILGEAPGKTEDAKGRQFVGESGRKLRKYIPEGWEAEVRWNNCIRCRPPNNRDPKREEIEACRVSVMTDIAETQPVAIVGAGNFPLNWLLDENSITVWRGRKVPVNIAGHVCWFFPVMHPAALLHSRDNKLEQVFARDLGRVFSPDLADETPEVVDPADAHTGVVCVDNDISQVKAFLDEMMEEPEVAFDFETRNLKPYASDSLLLTLAFGTDKRIVAFPLDHPESVWSDAERMEVHHLVRQFLSHYEGVKIAHNLAFESEWTAHYLGNDLLRKGQWADTMLMAYILDERKGGMSLDFCCLENFGFHLKAISDVDRTKLASTRLAQVLSYNALDVKYEYKLAQRLRERLERNDLVGVYQEHLRRVPALVLAQQRGLYVDQERVEFFYKSLGEQTKEIKAALKEQPEVQAYEKQFGPFKVTDDSVVVLLRDVMHCDAGRKKLGGYTGNKAVLKEIGGEVCEKILKYRSVGKLRSTYVAPLREGGKVLFPDGRLHTSYNQCFTVTGRLSSDKPNVQNFPKREHREIRGMICAPPGHVLVCADYGQIEYRMMVEVSQDPALLKALRERFDIHMYWTEEVAKLFPFIYKAFDKDIRKMRTMMKNAWTFPIFYGSVLESVAAALSSQARHEVPVRKLQPLYEEFWDEYSGVKKWQNATLVSYAQKGYVTCLSGRRRHAPLDDTMIYNTPIQGTASDVLNDGTARLSEKACNEGKIYLQPVLSVHDEMGFYVPDQLVDTAVEEIVIEMLRPSYSWVTVPLSVEVELGRNWYEMDKVGEFFSDEI